MAELGETSDPVALIPGSVNAMDAASARWRTRAARAGDAARALHASGVPEDWTGQAADAFETRVASVSSRWTTLAETFTVGASALTAYSSTLSWAQAQAGRAVELWQHAARLSAAGWNDVSLSHGLTGKAKTVPAIDEGAPLRQQAEQLLADARTAVAAAGDDAAAALDAAAAQPDLDADTWAALASLDGSPTAALAAVAGLHGDDLASLLRVRPDLAAMLARSRPAEVATWWQRLDDEQRHTLITSMPAVIGNLEGVSYASRDEANRAWLDAQLADAHAALDAAKAPLPWWEATAAGVTTAQALRIAEANTRLAALTNIRSTLDTLVGGAPRFLVSLTGDVPPLAAVSVGDLDTADVVTYAVPGMGTTTEGMSDWARAAKNIADAQARVDPRSHAVVAWIGYKTPPVPALQGGLEVMGTDFATAGAAKLDTALGGLDATRPDAQVNVVAHSYGTTTAAIALTDPGTHVDAFVSLGSAGLPPEIDQASDLHASEVFAGQAQDVMAIDPAPGDQWAWTGRLSPEHPVNPIDPGFGAHGFSVAGSPGMTGVGDHSALMPNGTGYLDADTASIINVAYATTGQAAKVSAYVPPEPTPFQRGLIEGQKYGY